MTPEERANVVVVSFDNFVCESPNSKPDIYAAYLSEKIATAIREAVAAEREACAAIADSFDCADARFALPNEAITAALGIAIAIRSRGEA